MTLKPERCGYYKKRGPAKKHRVAQTKEAYRRDLRLIQKL